MVLLHQLNWRVRPSYFSYPGDSNPADHEGLSKESTAKYNTGMTNFNYSKILVGWGPEESGLVGWVWCLNARAKRIQLSTGFVNRT